MLQQSLPQHTPVAFFNATTHLEIGEGYVDLYLPKSDSYAIHKVVGGNTHIHMAPAANVRVRARKVA